MNKKVFVSMLVLVVTFLSGMYIFKIFFPQEFVMCVENERIVMIGKYIDAHQWLYTIIGICTSFITYWLYSCAVCKKKYLGLKQCLIILVVIAISIVVHYIDEIATPIYNYIAFVILPILIGDAELKRVGVVFSVHTLAQYLSINIRNLPMYMEHVNSLSIYFMTFESYLWLILFYIIYNYKEKEVTT